MLRTELFKQMKTWSSEDIKTFTIQVLFPIEKERVLDAIFTVARSAEINEALAKMGKTERLQ